MCITYCYYKKNSKKIKKRISGMLTLDSNGNDFQGINKCDFYRVILLYIYKNKLRKIENED